MLRHHVAILREFNNEGSQVKLVVHLCMTEEFPSPQGLVIAFKVPLWMGNCIQHKTLLFMGGLYCVYFRLTSRYFCQYCLSSKTVLTRTHEPPPPTHPTPSSNILRFTFQCFVNLTWHWPIDFTLPLHQFWKNRSKILSTSNVFVQEINCTRPVQKLYITST